MISPASDDVFQEITKDPKMVKLIEDLEFIDQPLVPKRGKKASKALSKKNGKLAAKQGQSLQEIDEEKRRRKNKHQVKFLQIEYSKNQNWSREYMKDLAKKIGLKPSQVYKWNWDQKKKEVD